MTFEELVESKLDTKFLSLYNYAFIASRRYRRYEIKKRSGGTRTIHHPAKQLKVYQRFIAENIFLQLPIHERVYSYKEKTSIRDLALLHVNNRFLLRIDFKDFFPSIKGEYIREYLKKHQYDFEFMLSDKDITIINMLVCKNNKLTIGAPSSPIISNVLLYEFDQIMNSMFHQDIIYSRYADDLYFSTNTPNVLTDVPRKIKDFLSKYHIKLKVNNSKTVFTSKKHKRIITGLTITTENTVSVGREKKVYIKGLVYKYINKKIEHKDLIYLKGYLSYVKSVDVNFFELLHRKYSSEIINELSR